MKIRLARKIMKRACESFRYMRMILDGLDLVKELPKIKQYWEPRWALYFTYKGGDIRGRRDHRIVKAISLNKKIKNIE